MNFHRSTGAIALLIAMLAASACNLSVSFGDDVVGTGDVITQSYELDDFDRLSVESGFDVLVRIGDDFSVETRSNESLVDDIDLGVRNGLLTLRLADGGGLREGTLEADITLPALLAVEVSGPSTAEVRGVVDPAPTFEISGAGDLAIFGSAATLELTATGATDTEIRLTTLNELHVEMSGAASAAVVTVDQVTGQLSGATSLTVPSAAELDVKQTGASSIAVVD